MLNSGVNNALELAGNSELIIEMNLFLKSRKSLGSESPIRLMKMKLACSNIHMAI